MNRLEKIHEGELKSTPSINQEAHRRWFLVLIRKVQSFIFLYFIVILVLFPFLTIVDEKIFLCKAFFNRQKRICIDESYRCAG
jgi:hypothetical protein